jgi:hypothetical protein
MAAKLMHHERFVKGNVVVEIKIWSVPIGPRIPHGYKYSLVCVKDERRIIGYDNAEGKGDHRHCGDAVEPYDFTDIDTLFADFYSNIKEVWHEG